MVMGQPPMVSAPWRVQQCRLMEIFACRQHAGCVQTAGTSARPHDSSTTMIPQHHRERKAWFPVRARQYVRCPSWSGRHLLILSLTGYDPERTTAASVYCNALRGCVGAYRQLWNVIGIAGSLRLDVGGPDHP